MKEKSCGTITIKDNKVLIVQQKSGNYGFPKGHVIEGETEIETAIRETKEETNIDVEINNENRHAIYYMSWGNKKEVIYFVATPKNEDIIKQDTEIKESFWLDINEVENILTFDNLKEIWRNVLNEL